MVIWLPLTHSAMGIHIYVGGTHGHTGHTNRCQQKAWQRNRSRIQAERTVQRVSVTLFSSPFNAAAASELTHAGWFCSVILDTANLKC